MKSLCLVLAMSRPRVFVLPVFLLLLSLLLNTSACGHPFKIDTFTATYTEGGTLTHDSVQAVVSYDKETGKYTKTRSDFSSPPNQLSSEQNQLTPDKQAALSSLLDTLSIDSYRTAYTEPPPASAGDGSPVVTIFEDGRRKKEILMDTNVENTVPSPLMNFFASIRDRTYF